MQKKELVELNKFLFDVIIELGDKPHLEGLSNYLYNLSSFLLCRKNLDFNSFSIKYKKNFLEDHKNGKI